MKTITLKSIDQLHSFLNKFSKLPKYKYRGQSNSEWLLLPKAGRLQYRNVPDIWMFKQWKRRAYGILSKSYNLDIEYLSIAQHNGLPTRLLDWSHTPLITLFFAVIENKDKDGALFLYQTSENEIDFDSKNSPFDFNDNYYFHLPTSTSNRLDNQFGHFSVHKNPNIEFEKICITSNLTKLIIPKLLKQDILLMLNQYGINYLSVYPDLEGLSKHLCWFYENYDIWRGKSPD